MIEQNSLQIRPARSEDLNAIMQIFERARSFMASVGNPSQWVNGYPQRELMVSEIETNHCYVCVDPSDTIVATFCFIVGIDPTYLKIEGKGWLNDEPYAVIHRIASAGTHKGIADLCFQWCFTKCQNLRIDTHRDNKVLQSIFHKYGFSYCGIIHLANGAERLAYQRICKEE